MEPATDIATVKKRGRPRLAEPKVCVSTWVEPSEYDRIIKLAARRREPISSLVRSLLMLRLPPDHK